MTEPPPRRRSRPRWLEILLGTAPGLEVFVLAALPAIAAIGVAYGVFHWSGLVSTVAGFAVLGVGIAIARVVVR